MIIAVRGLDTGYSTDVHGQLFILSKNNNLSLPQTQTLQYKTYDTTIRFFDKGFAPT